jgi:hypothetical protein
VKYVARQAATRALRSIAREVGLDPKTIRRMALAGPLRK